MSLDYLTPWYSALQSTHGVAVIFEGNYRTVMAHLYAARRKAGDPALGALAIVTPILTQTELWIVHKEIKNDSAEGRPSDDEAHLTSL